MESSQLLPNNQFEQVGWWIPGKLNPGWASQFQANFVDMANKFNQLGIKSLVNGMLPSEETGFYFSQAEFDFIQLLTVCPPQGTQISEGQNFQNLASYSIVTYSIWLSSVGWGGFSPIPILKPSFLSDSSPCEESLPILTANYSTYYPMGWYFTGSFSAEWHNRLEDNYKLAEAKRKELNITDLSPLYFCQSTFYDCVQMVLAPPIKQADPSIAAAPDAGVIQEYVSWFNAKGFGNLKCVPFMSIDLVNESLQLAGKTP